MPGPGPDRKFRALAALGGAAVLCAPDRVVCAPQDEVTRRDWGIAGFKPPPRWELHPPDRPMYPQVLAWASRGQGAERAVITLVAKRLTPGTSAQAFANESAALREAGVRNIRLQPQPAEGWGHRVQLDGVIIEGGAQRRLVRQLYFVNGSVGYVLTLVAPQAQALPRLRDLEDVAAGLAPIPTDPSARPPAQQVPPQPPSPSVQPLQPVAPGEGAR